MNELMKQDISLRMYGKKRRRSGLRRFYSS